MNINFNKLDTKEKLLILKAIIDITKNIYDNETTFILSQVLKQEDNQIKNEYGQFGKRSINAKTVMDIIQENNNKIKKLQLENKELEQYTDKNTVIKQSNTILTSKYSTLSENIANDIVKDIISTFDSKRLEKNFK